METNISKGTFSLASEIS